MSTHLSTDSPAAIAEEARRSFDRNQTMSRSGRAQKSIRVLLVDDSMLTLHGLKVFLAKSSHIEVVGLVSSPSEVLTTIQIHRPDVVMMEVEVGRMNGIDLCKKIRSAHPYIGVLFFTDHDNKELLRAAIVAGAQGYLLKTAAADAVAKSIEIVASGQAILDHQLTEHVIAWVKNKGSAVFGTAKRICSAEDLELLSYVASGKTNREIALELDVTTSIVATRLQRIYKRLRISRRSEAARYYVRLEKGLEE
ncbi:MAG: hypothetical protein CV090_03385 [Nitrospira sp. WS238]|nr:hypothetical protein [Nitrospira sp. WS238]